MIVRRMEQGEMQDRRQRVVLADREAHALRADRIFVGGGPAVGIRHHAHAVGTQRMQFVRRAVEAHRLHIGVARHHQVPVEALEKTLPALARIGPARAARAADARTAPGLRPHEHQRQRRRRLAHQPHGAMHDGVLLKTLAGERRIIARRPHGAPGDVERDGALRARGLGLGRGLKPAGQSVQHERLLPWRGIKEIKFRHKASGDVEAHNTVIPGRLVEPGPESITTTPQARACGAPLLSASSAATDSGSAARSRNDTRSASANGKAASRRFRLATTSADGDEDGGSFGRFVIGASHALG